MARWAPTETVDAAIRGDATSAERLVSSIWAACFRLAASVLGDRGLAQDAAQEACAIVHRRIGGLRDAAAFDAWLYRIVMREAARVRRRNPPVFNLPDDAAVPRDGSTEIDVWSALATLTADQREAVVLFYFDDLKSEEIARILGVAHGTVRTRLARARERLRGALDDYRFETSRQERAHHAI